MPKASPIQTSFNAGQWGARLQGRIDLAKYGSACNVMENFIPTVQGPAHKRSGTKFVKAAADQSNACRLIPFEFSIVQAYMLELSAGKLRVYKNSGAVLESPAQTITGISAANPVVVTAANSYSNGDEVYISGTAQAEVNGRFFTVAGATGASFQLSGEDGTGRSTGSGGTSEKVYEIDHGVASNSIPWLATELEAVQFVQNADVLYLVHPNHPPHKITRSGDTSWTCTEIAFNWPPFRPENSDDDVVMTISAESGTGVQIQVRGKAGEEISTTATASNATPVVVTVASTTGLANGDVVYTHGFSGTGASSINNEHWEIANVTGTTFELVGSTAPGGALAGGTIEEIDTSFQFTSDMVDAFFKFREILESNNLEWFENSAAGLRVREPRFGASAVAGDVVYYAGNAYESGETNDVTGFKPPVHDKLEDGFVTDGSKTWKFFGRGAGYAKITAVNADGFSCTADIVWKIPYSVTDSNPSETARALGEWIGTPSPRWAEGAWSAENGYPRAVAFFEDRLWFAGTDADPQTFWGSRVGDYEDFEEVDDDASSGLLFTLNSAEINAIESMAGDQALILLTRKGAFVASSGTEQEAITSDNITVRRQTNAGGAEGVQPRFVDSALIFAQRAAQRLHQLVYNTSSGRFAAPDLTDLEPDILRPGIAQIEYQSAPFRQIWARTTDGQCAAQTHIADQDVYGWAEMLFGGSDVDVEAMGVIPHPDGDEDQLWLAIARTVDSATVRYIEILEKPFDADDALSAARFVDSYVRYTGASTTSIVGLDHLEGETVQVFAAGTVLGEETVSGGAITIDSAQTDVVVGLKYTARLQTMRLEAGAASGAAQGRRGRVHQCVHRLDRTGEGLQAATDFDAEHLNLVEDISAGSLFTGDTESRILGGGFNRERRVAYLHDQPTPCTIVAAMPQLTVEER